MVAAVEAAAAARHGGDNMALGSWADERSMPASAWRRCPTGFPAGSRRRSGWEADVALELAVAHRGYRVVKEAFTTRAAHSSHPARAAGTRSPTARSAARSGKGATLVLQPWRRDRLAVDLDVVRELHARRTRRPSHPRRVGNMQPRLR